MTTPFPDAPTAPAPPPAPPEPPIRRRRWPVVVTVGVMAFFVILLGTVIRLPYVIYSPGSATPVEGIVRISGARRIRTAGRCSSSPSRCRAGRPNVWRYLVAKLDDDSQIVGESTTTCRAQSRATVQKENVVAMDDSPAGGEEGGARAARLHGGGHREGRRWS